MGAILRTIGRGLEGFVVGATVWAFGTAIVPEYMKDDDFITMAGGMAVVGILYESFLGVRDLFRSREHDRRIEGYRARRDAEMNRRTRYSTYRDSNN